MKCTDCGTDVKPIVAVDIDGTLGDYYKHFHAFAQNYVGHTLPERYDGSIEYSEYLGLDKQLYRDIKLAYRQGGLKRSMPLHFSAGIFMEDIRDMGFEIWIATTRPYLRLDNIDPDTQEWLDRKHITYDYLIYGEDKYKQLTSRVDESRIVAVIDDLKEQCVIAADVMIPSKVWQPEREHNEGLRWAYHFYPWLEMVKWLQGSKEVWDAQYGAGHDA